MVNWLLVLAVVALAGLPLLVVDGEFGGADGVAAEQIAADHPDYRPWFAPLFSPSAEVASGLFALQAAVGAGFLGYYFGAARTKRRLGTGRSTAAEPAPPTGDTT
nr:energy-coupling factor ABC transporter substrate-binding protein [Pseudonocardia acidicola]